jgi:hypothetical protein
MDQKEIDHILEPTIREAEERIEISKRGYREGRMEARQEAEGIIKGLRVLIKRGVCELCDRTCDPEFCPYPDIVRADKYLQGDKG